MELLKDISNNRKKMVLHGQMGYDHMRTTQKSDKLIDIIQEREPGT
jgi:hypothetical protein